MVKHEVRRIRGGSMELLLTATLNAGRYLDSRVGIIIE